MDGSFVAVGVQRAADFDFFYNAKLIIWEDKLSYPKELPLLTLE